MPISPLHFNVLVVTKELESNRIVLLALAEPAYDCPPSNSFEKKLPTICTSREAGLILH
jgi:hypothetical protein